MTDEKIIEVMENMKFHADRTDDTELIDACDGAIKALKNNAKLKEAVKMLVQCMSMQERLTFKRKWLINKHLKEI